MALMGLTLATPSVHAQEEGAGRTRADATTTNHEGDDGRSASGSRAVTPGKTEGAGNSRRGKSHRGKSEQRPEDSPDRCPRDSRSLRMVLALPEVNANND